MDDRILLIRTGGTIDAEAYENPRNPPPLVNTLKDGYSLIMSFVNTLPNHEYVDGFTWGRWEENRFVKDSKLFTPQEIHELAKLIRADDHRCFIITHGTDAMVKNARLLQEWTEGSGKTVLMVGSMVPLSMHEAHGSDGVVALRHAMARAQTQPAGTYILARHAVTHEWEFFNPLHIEKNRELSLRDIIFTVNVARG